MEATPLREDRMKKALNAAFAPVELKIVDDSARHAGHSGAREGGQTHYNVRIVSQSFNGLNRVARQRAVMDALAAEFAGGLHALSMELKTPDEA